MLSNDQLCNEKFDYCLVNFFFGVKWEKVQKDIQVEYFNEGYGGCFGLGLLWVGDGFLLFLMYLLFKCKLVGVNSNGICIGIVLFGSLLFNGGVGFGESEICCWILENDWFEVIVVLLNDLFYNIGIGIYIWVLSNNKVVECKNLVQLIDVIDMYLLMQKLLGSKCKCLFDEQIDGIVCIQVVMIDNGVSKLFKIMDFGYCCIMVEWLFCM